jgi:hypothetical protein
MVLCGCKISRSHVRSTFVFFLTWAWSPIHSNFEFFRKPQVTRTSDIFANCGSVCNLWWWFSICVDFRDYIAAETCVSLVRLMVYLTHLEWWNPKILLINPHQAGTRPSAKNVEKRLNHQVLVVSSLLKSWTSQVWTRRTTLVHLCRTLRLRFLMGALKSDRRNWCMSRRINVIRSIHTALCVQHFGCYIFLLPTRPPGVCQKAVREQQPS